MDELFSIKAIKIRLVYLEPVSQGPSLQNWRQESVAAERELKGEKQGAGEKKRQRK